MNRRIILTILVLLTISSAIRAQNGINTFDTIAVRVVDGSGEFYDTVTGERFVIRGPNYHHLERDRSGYVVDRLFAPAYFDAERIASELRSIRDLGYNTVRIALDICRSECLTAANSGIQDDYVDNIASFLQLAHDTGLYVILTANDFPERSIFVQRMEAQCCDPFDGYMNTHYLSPIGLKTWKEYWQTVIHGLFERGAPMDTILAYSARGEMWFFADKAPLSLRGGSVTTANGVTYDLSDPAQRQAMLDEGAVYWLNEMRAAIREAHPGVLVTVGIFTPNEPNNWRGDDPRFVVPLSVLAESEIDFFDLHPYPGYLPLDAMMENYHLEGLRGQPVIIGEFGAFKFHFGTPEAGALGVRAWQTDSCAYDVQGWMHWHWTGENDHEVWTGTEGGGAINAALAPANRPDPCIIGDYALPTSNVALGGTTRSSRELPDQPAANLVDGTSAPWGAGADAPQWVEIDFGGAFTINRVTLQVAQYPAGETRHQLWALMADGTRVLLQTFDLYTSDDAILSVSLNAPLANVTGIRVETLESPSWVSWKEIEVFAGGEGAACIVRASGTVNLRGEATTSAGIAGSLTAGSGAVVDQTTHGGDGMRWYQLLSGAWVREDVVSLGEGCDALPDASS